MRVVGSATESVRIPKEMRSGEGWRQRVLNRNFCAGSPMRAKGVTGARVETSNSTRVRRVRPLDNAAASGWRTWYLGGLCETGITGSRPGRITIEAGKCGGRPCLRGMRIGVSDVLGLLSAGAPVDEILQDYPDFEREDVLAAIEYAAFRTDHAGLLPV